MNSIYTGRTVIIPMADIQHCERLFRSARVAIKEGPQPPQPNGLRVVTSKTTYNQSGGHWENTAYILEDEREQFLEAWHAYRERVETPMVVINPSPKANIDQSVSRKKIQRVVMGSFSPAHGGDVDSWQLWVCMGKGRVIRIETTPNLTSEMMLGCTIEFQEPLSESVSWMGANEYEVVYVSGELKRVVLEICDKNTTSSTALSDQIAPKDLVKLLIVLEEKYGIYPPSLEGADSIGEVLCEFAAELHVRGNPSPMETKIERRSWQVLNSVGTVKDEFTCEGDPLAHYAFITHISTLLVRSLGYTARQVRASESS